MPVKIRGSFGSLLRPDNFGAELDNHFLTKYQEAVDAGNISSGGGSILQVVNTLTSSRSTYTSSDAGTTITPLTTSITPSATTSKVWVTVTMTYEAHHDVGFLLSRGTTPIGRNTASTARHSMTWVHQYDNNQSSTPITQTWTFLDSPNSTSAQSYSIRVKRSSTTSHVLYLNRCFRSAGNNADEIGTSSMTLMEVAG